MKVFNLFFFSFITSILIFQASTIYSQQPGWQWLNPKPQGNGVTSMYFTSDLVGYAATWSNSVMKTTDGGISWELTYINSDISLGKVQFLNSQTGFISTSSNKFCKTINAGINWEVIIALRPDLKFRNIFFEDESTGYATYDSTYNRKYFGKTTDGGLTWNELRLDTSIFTTLFALNGENIFFALSKDSTFGYITNLYKSTDGGDNWTYINSFPKSISGLSFSSYDTGYVYLSTYVNSSISDLYKTTNGGINWNIIDQNRPGSRFQIINNNNLIQANLGYNGRLYYSSNGGGEWDSSYIPNSPSFSFNPLYYDFLYFKDFNNGFITGPNIIHTSNRGKNWIDEYPDNIYGHFWGMDFVNENTGFVTSSNSKTYKTTNSGQTWELTLSSSENFEDIQFINSETGFMGSHWGGMFARTTNGGSNWDTIPTNMSFTALSFLNESTGYATGKYGPVRKTTNGGLNWIYLTGIYGQSFDIDFINENTGLVASGGAFKRTTNGGITWDSIAIPFNTFVFQIRFINENEVLAGTIGGASNDDLIIKSTNGGINWYSVYTLDGGFGELEAAGNNVYALSYYYNRLSKSTDRGNTWRTYNTIAYREGYRIKFINENTGFIAGWGSSIIKTTNGGFDPIGIEPISAEIPSGYLLQQNYPNPFNPTTRIKFAIPHSGLVKLTVYDIIGRKVSELVNRSLSAGSYESEFDGSGLTSGVYFYRLEAGDFAQTKRMVLVK